MEEVVDCSFDNQVPSKHSSCFAAEASAWGAHSGNAAVACTDWDRCASHDEDEAPHDSSFHFDILKISFVIINGLLMRVKRQVLVLWAIFCRIYENE